MFAMDKAKALKLVYAYLLIDGSIEYIRKSVHSQVDLTGALEYLYPTTMTNSGLQKNQRILSATQFLKDDIRDDLAAMFRRKVLEKEISIPTFTVVTEFTDTNSAPDEIEIVYVDVEFEHHQFRLIKRGGVKEEIIQAIKMLRQEYEFQKYMQIWEE